MQETRKNCFGSIKRSTTFLQAITGKHEYRKLSKLIFFASLVFVKYIIFAYLDIYMSQQYYKLFFKFKILQFSYSIFLSFYELLVYKDGIKLFFYVFITHYVIICFLIACELDAVKNRSKASLQVDPKATSVTSVFCENIICHYNFCEDIF